MAELADVVVIGAGPAGTAAAITAARNGARVVCVDKAEFPRDKTCGDGLTANALRLLAALGVSNADLAGADPAFVRETILVSPSGRRVHLPLPSDGAHAAVVSRRVLDAVLVDVARRTGVEVREGIAVAAVDQSREAVVCTLDDGTRIEAPHAVAADGHWSVVRRALEP